MSFCLRGALEGSLVFERFSRLVVELELLLKFDVCESCYAPAVAPSEGIAVPFVDCLLTISLLFSLSSITMCIYLA